jgi:hypothetical protein
MEIIFVFTHRRHHQYYHGIYHNFFVVGRQMALPTMSNNFDVTILVNVPGLTLTTFVLPSMPNDTVVYIGQRFCFEGTSGINVCTAIIIFGNVLLLNYAHDWI